MPLHEKLLPVLAADQKPEAQGVGTGLREVSLSMLKAHISPVSLLLLVKQVCQRIQEPTKMCLTEMATRKAQTAAGATLKNLLSLSSALDWVSITGG